MVAKKQAAPSTRDWCVNNNRIMGEKSWNIQEMCENSYLLAKPLIFPELWLRVEKHDCLNAVDYLNPLNWNACEIILCPLYKKTWIWNDMISVNHLVKASIVIWKFLIIILDNNCKYCINGTSISTKVMVQLKHVWDYFEVLFWSDVGYGWDC